MSDRYHSLTVVLEHDIRDDDAVHIINAIKQLRGVLDATGVVSDMDTHMAETRARYSMLEKARDMILSPSP